MGSYWKQSTPSGVKIGETGVKMGGAAIPAKMAATLHSQVITGETAELRNVGILGTNKIAWDAVGWISWGEIKEAGLEESTCLTPCCLRRPTVACPLTSAQTPGASLSPFGSGWRKRTIS